MRHATSRRGLIVGVGIAAAALAGCGEERRTSAGRTAAAETTPVIALVQAGRHILVFEVEQVPPDFAGRVAGAGGTLDASLDEIGVAVVSGIGTEGIAALARAEEVLSVLPDAVSVLADVAEAAEEGATVADTPVDGASLLDPAFPSPKSATLYPRQWNLRAIGADKAWDAGHLGTNGLTVAVLDTGIDYLHPELAGLVDLGRSASFVSGVAGQQEASTLASLFPGMLPFTDMLGHGTAVASTVGTNAIRLAGVTRSVTILAVKVANRFGQFSVADAVAGLKYAVDAGADVINVSGGGYFDREDDEETIELYRRVNNYAFRRGALIVGISGNAAENNQHDEGKVRYCEIGNGLCVGATAPTGASVSSTGEWTFTAVDTVPAYSGIGRSAVDVVAPGGERASVTGSDATVVSAPCLTTWTSTSPAPCRVAACRERDPTKESAKGTACIYPGRGTSFAAPHTAGLTALLVQQMGHGNPAGIRARIVQTSDDLGAPGVDPYYGTGRINVARALGLEP